MPSRKNGTANKHNTRSNTKEPDTILPNVDYTSDSSVSTDGDDSEWIPDDDVSIICTNPTSTRSSTIGPQTRSSSLLYLFERALFDELEDINTNVGKRTPRKKRNVSPSTTSQGNPKRTNVRIPNKLLMPPPFVPRDLIGLIKLSNMCQKKVYKDCHRLGDLYECLVELDGMIGLRTIKQQVYEFIVFKLQQTPTSQKETTPMSHMILTGPPGCGKTTLSTILAKIFCRLGMCERETIVYGTQSNMIAGYLGQTATKTEEIIRQSFGGVLVIDEASSLADGRSDQNSDSFSKSCLDTLNRMLSEHGDKFICILAGYKTEVYRDILSMNPGMARRFSIKFEIDDYKPEDIRRIFDMKLQKKGITLDGNQCIPPTEWFVSNMKYFPHYGGDCDVLVDKVVTQYYVRTFGTGGERTLSRQDVENGFKVMQKQYSCNKDTNEDPSTLCMYT